MRWRADAPHTLFSPLLATVLGGLLCGLSLSIQLLTGAGCWAPIHVAADLALLAAALGTAISITSVVLARARVQSRSAPWWSATAMLAAGCAGFGFVQLAFMTLDGIAIGVGWLLTTLGALMIFTGRVVSLARNYSLSVVGSAVVAAAFCLAVLYVELAPAATCL